MSESEGSNNVKGLDLGWNDPPMFSYDSRQVYNNVKKPTLTKRVGLSWESPSPAPPGSKSDEPVIPASAPPRGPAPGPPPPSSSNRVMHSSPAVPPQPSAPPIEDEGKPDPPKLVENLATENSEINLDSVSKALSDLAETLLGDKEREKAEIMKRLSILDSLWQEDKFPEDLKEKLHKISEALKIGNVDEADTLQRGLMIDHSGLCSTWMAAVRKLISTRRQHTS